MRFSVFFFTLVREVEITFPLNTALNIHDKMCKTSYRRIETEYDTFECDKDL